MVVCLCMMKLIIVMVVIISRLMISMLVRFLLKFRCEVSVVRFRLVVRLVIGFIYLLWVDVVVVVGVVVVVVLGVVVGVCVGVVVGVLVGGVFWCCMLKDLLLLMCWVLVFMVMDDRLMVNIMVSRERVFFMGFLVKGMGMYGG